MAHYKRRRPRTAGGRGNNRPHWLNDPAWWDIMFHRRPHRRKTKKYELQIVGDYVDADDIPWPVDRKPHKYYW